MDCNGMTALEMGRLIRERKLGCVEAAEFFLGNIRKNDNEINAYTQVLSDKAIGDAASVQRRLDNGEDLSPLAGVPMGIKDNISTKDITTSCGSRMLVGYKPVFSATAVERLSDAGAVMLGKLNMDEFAMGSSTETSFYGTVKNPWDQARVPGGSSGGSAAAVASGEAAYTLGSDTGGSIRQPCSFCGVTGIKPTYGSVSRYGLVAYASSLDQIGPIGRDIRDCAEILSIISGPDAKDSTSAIRQPFDFSESYDGSVSGMRICLPKEFMESESIDGEVYQAVIEAARMYEKMGAVVEDFSMPIVNYAIPAYYIIACAEASANLSRYDGIKYGYRSSGCESLADVYVKSRSEGFGTEVKHRIMLGSFVLSSGYYDAYYRKAQQARQLIRRAFFDAFEKYNCILCPTAPTSAFRLGEHENDPLRMYMQDIYTVPVNLAGLPAAALPCGFSSNGMPIGMQLIGKAFDEPTIVKVAYAFQKETDYHTRRPRGTSA